MRARQPDHTDFLMVPCVFVFSRNALSKGGIMKQKSPTPLLVKSSWSELLSTAVCREHVRAHREAAALQIAERITDKLIEAAKAPTHYTMRSDPSKIVRTPYAPGVAQHNRLRESISTMLDHTALNGSRGVPAARRTIDSILEYYRRQFEKIAPLETKSLEELAALGDKGRESRKHELEAKLAEIDRVDTALTSLWHIVSVYTMEHPLWRIRNPRAPGVIRYLHDAVRPLRTEVLEMREPIWEENLALFQKRWKDTRITSAESESESAAMGQVLPLR